MNDGLNPLVVFGFLSLPPSIESGGLEYILRKEETAVTCILLYTKINNLFVTSIFQ